MADKKMRQIEDLGICVNSLKQSRCLKCKWSTWSIHGVVLIAMDKTEAWYEDCALPLCVSVPRWKSLYEGYNLMGHIFQETLAYCAVSRVQIEWKLHVIWRCTPPPHYASPLINCLASKRRQANVSLHGDRVTILV